MKEDLVILVPNITNICYGRGVGYKIEEIVLSEEIQKISVTKIRAKNARGWRFEVNERLKSIVDLQKYPIYDLNSPIIKILSINAKKN